MWGDTQEEEKFRERECPKCGSDKVEEKPGLFTKTWICRNCGHNLTSA